MKIKIKDPMSKIKLSLNHKEIKFIELAIKELDTSRINIQEFNDNTFDKFEVSESLNLALMKGQILYFISKSLEDINPY